MSESEPSKSGKLPRWVGAYGAVVATVALSWNVFQYFDSRPRLEVQIDGSGGLLTDNTLWPHVQLSTPNPLIRFINRGSKPLTIYFMQADFRPNPSSIPHVDGYSSAFGTPLKLDAGDAKDWRPSLVPSPSGRADKLKAIHVSGKLRILALTTNGKYEKQSEIAVTLMTAGP